MAYEAVFIDRGSVLNREVKVTHMWLIYGVRKSPEVAIEHSITLNWGLCGIWWDMIFEKRSSNPI